MKTPASFAAASQWSAVDREAERILNNRVGDRSRPRMVAQVLAALRLGPVTSARLAAITPRYGARVYDLRRLGCVIETRNRTEGAVYVLRSEPGGAE